MVKYTTPLKGKFLELILIFYMAQHYTFRVLQLHVGWLTDWVLEGNNTVMSRAQEDFLKTTYLLRSEGKPATNSEIASAMDMSPAAVSGMAKRLGEAELLVYHKYQNIDLTRKGTVIALEILRHHRLLELFFTETLNVPWELVHAFADKMEHDLDEFLADAIDTHLDSPSVDPHGDPIPNKDGTMPDLATMRLVEQPLQRWCEVARVLTQDREKLLYLGSIGLRPRAKVTVQEKMPFNGPLRLLIEDAETIIGYEIARLILVSSTERA